MKAAVWVLAGGLFGAAAPMTLEQVSALSQSNSERVRLLEEEVASLRVRLDGMERRMAQCGPGGGSAAVPADAGASDTVDDEAVRPNEWSFTITSIEPQDTSALELEMQKKAEKATSLREEADRRSSNGKRYLHTSRQRQRMREEASSIELEVWRLRKRIEHPGMILRGLDEEMREVVCICEQRLAGQIKRLRVGDDVTVRGEMLFADTSMIELEADRFVAR